MKNRLKEQVLTFLEKGGESIPEKERALIEKIAGIISFEEEPDLDKLKNLMSEAEGASQLCNKPTILEGVKHDKGKPRMDLIPPEALTALGEVLHFGAEVKEYGERNWEKGMPWGKVYGATLRHLNQWNSGVDKDPESGLSHLNHALANIAFLIAYEKRQIGKDTRK